MANIPEETVSKPEKKSGKMKKIIIILFVLVVLCGAGATGYLYMTKLSKSSSNAAQNANKPPDNPATTNLGSMLVNLSGGEHYIRLTPVLEYQSNSKLDAELKTKNYIIADTVISYLRSKSLSDVQAPESIGKIRVELANAINKKLVSGKIYRVYFTEYLTQ